LLESAVAECQHPSYVTSHMPASVTHCKRQAIKIPHDLLLHNFKTSAKIVQDTYKEMPLSYRILKIYGRHTHTHIYIYIYIHYLCGLVVGKPSYRLTGPGFDFRR
jgi:hypothetical protein